MEITPPVQRNMKLLPSGELAVLSQGGGHSGQYLVQTMEGERLLQVISFEKDTCFTADGRAFPCSRLQGMVHVLIREEKINGN